MRERIHATENQNKASVMHQANETWFFIETTKSTLSTLR